MPNIEEVSDGGPNTNTPSVAEMRDAQRVGSVGKGTSTETFAKRNACRNHGTGLGDGKDPQFSEAEAGVNAAEGKPAPWE